MKFSELKIRDRFLFTSELGWGLASGPWEKISQYKYRHISDLSLRTLRVPTVKVEVSRWPLNKHEEG